MASQEKIEALYYKAVQNAKLDDLTNITGQALGPPGYSRENFKRWARKIDIYTLGEGAANFSTKQHEEIVTKFGAYRQHVATKLADELRYENLPLNGQLRDIGSCIDGSKVGSVNEMDSLYVIQGNDLTVEESHKRRLYRVYLGKGPTRQEIQPRRLRQQFAEKYSEIISLANLPDCLGHGGYKRSSGQSHHQCNEQDKCVQLHDSGYSGVRYNGPAVTSQFCTKDNALLTWDVTPVVVLSDDTEHAEIQARVRESGPMRAIIADNPEKMFPPKDVHLFPDAAENLWRLSTAEMEADVPARMSKHAPFKEAFSSCKVLSTDLKNWHNKKARTAPPDVDIVDALAGYNEMKNSKAKMEAAETLNQKMRFAHIWIPADIQDEYNEDKKSNISINNAAVKHILLKAASNKKGAFGPEKNPDLVKELICITFEELSKDKSYRSEHALLPDMWISHFSVAPGVASQKLVLTRDISQQCRTLLHEAMTKPLPITTLAQSADELNRCAMELGELRCPEYSFQLTMNPWQHPELDKNIHHLFTLITSLCNTCGGVIFLTAEDPETNVTREVTERFQSRLSKLILETTEIRQCDKINFTHVPFCLGGRRPWTAIHLKISKQTPCLDSQSDSKLPEVRTDLYGFIQIEETSDHQHVELDPSSRVSSHEILPTGEDLEDTTESVGSGRTAVGSSFTPGNRSLVTSPSSDVATNLPVDFCFQNKLDWSKNKKCWERYVHGEAPNIGTIVNSCSLWKPTKPMTVTPDKATLKHWFGSVEDMERTLSEVDTKEPGFAVVCKTWKFHVSNSDTEARPPGHICDILTVSETGNICLWVICNDHDRPQVRYQIEHLLTTGRMIKYRVVEEAGDEDLSNIFIECRLYCPNASVQVYDTVNSAVKESLDMQSHIRGFCNEKRVNFETLQRALALVILSKESPLKRPVGNQTTITLSIQQVEVLSNEERVNYVCGPTGSGKSYTAALLCQMYGKDKCVYICTTVEFMEYLKFSGYNGTLIQKDQDLVREIKSGTFKDKTCIIIDDSHNFSCRKSSMKKLFRLVKANKDRSLYVFADNHYQSFDEKRQQAMRDSIRELSLQVFGKEPYYTYLTAIYRNTKKVVSFIQYTIQDTYEDNKKIECQNVETGDGIECIKMTNIWTQHGENDLVDYLHTIWATARYKVTETAVLLDPSYTSDKIEECRSILREHLPSSGVQSARVFPRKGVVVDSVSSFLGLDAPLCLFILPRVYSPREMKSFHQRLLKRSNKEPDATIGNPRFKVFMASRATHKAVFVVQRMDAELAMELKFDLFEPQPVIDYAGLMVTGRRKIQTGYELSGLCYSDGGLYVVQGRWEEPGQHRWSLAVYQVHSDSEDLTLTDTLEMGASEMWPVCPRFECHSRRVFVSCRYKGVAVVRRDGDRLVREKTLTCTRDARSMDTISPDTIYVCDWYSHSVHVVDVRDDRITLTLEKPDTLKSEWPWRLAVLGDSVIVGYTDSPLVVYHHGSPAPVRVIPRPETLRYVFTLSTDSQCHFMITDSFTKSVFIMDVSGNVLHTVNLDSDSLGPADCAVVNRQLWVGCSNGDIVIMSSQ